MLGVFSVSDFAFEALGFEGEEFFLKGSECPGTGHRLLVRAVGRWSGYETGANGGCLHAWRQSGRERIGGWCGAGDGGLLTGLGAEHKSSGDDERETYATENPPLIFLERIRCVDRVAESAAGCVGHGGLTGWGRLVRSRAGLVTHALCSGTALGLLLLARHGARARDSEGDRSTGFHIGGEPGLGARAAGITLERLKSLTGKGHGLGQHDGDVVGGHGNLGMEGGAAAVGQVVANLEARFSGTQGKDEGVVAFFSGGYGGTGDGHAAGTGRGGAFEDGIGRQIDLKTFRA